jgi:hypothetical protein
MEAIIKKDNFIIWRDKNKSLFKIEFKYTAYSLINSLIKSRIIPGAYTDEKYRIIKFKAHSVKTLKQYQHDYQLAHGRRNIAIPDAAKLISTLTKQLSYLIQKESSTIIGYNSEEMIVINDEKFAFLSSELVADIDPESQLAMISCPFSTNDFFVSPELFKIKELPAFIHYKTSYFSLACLALHLLLEDDEFYTEYTKHKQPEKILQKLSSKPIKETKLYWLLSRCLVEEPSERSILLI